MTTDWTAPETFDRVVQHAETREKGNYFEAFSEGDTLEHDPGLRLTAHGNELWMGQTLNHEPAFWRSEVAAASDYDEPPIHPDYLLAATMGPSVEDLSEKGGYFLGRSNVEIGRYPSTGTELRVESTVLGARSSSSRPDYGIVTWETRGIDADTGEVLCSYERTNMLPRRDPLDTDPEDDGEESSTDDATDGGNGRTPDLPTMIVPEGESFEAFRDAIEQARDADAQVAYRHERGRTMDDVLVSTLPLATLNTARQHHNADEMADSPSGEIVAYGDVTRSIVLAHARSDEHTYRELGYDDERFHEFVTGGDTVYGFTRVLAVDGERGPDEAGLVTFEHIGFNQHRTPVYSGQRRALIERREDH